MERSLANSKTSRPTGGLASEYRKQEAVSPRRDCGFRFARHASGTSGFAASWRASCRYLTIHRALGPTASTNKEYFSIKIGQQTTFYKNMTTGTLDLRFLKGTASQAFSHLTEYGDPVPLPGAVWLFGSAMVGLVALNRRRKMAG